MIECGERLKPVLKWAGGKSQLLSQLRALFPERCERLLEPFVGGGAVFLAAHASLRTKINDANPEIANLYQSIRDRPTELMAALDALAARYSEHHYYDVRSAEPADPVERAARTLYLNKTGFNGLYRQNARGTFNVPFGKRVECPRLYGRENLLRISQRLASVEIANVDFETLLDEAGEGDFVYCDPPYEPLSATSSFNAYKAGGFSRSEQVRLKEACERAVARGAKVAVSNSAAEFIQRLYAEHTVHSVSARRSINSNASGRGEIREILVQLGYGSAPQLQPSFPSIAAQELAP